MPRLELALARQLMLPPPGLMSRPPADLAHHLDLVSALPPRISPPRARRQPGTSAAAAACCVRPSAGASGRLGPRGRCENLRRCTPCYFWTRPSHSAERPARCRSVSICEMHAGACRAALHQLRCEWRRRKGPSLRCAPSLRVSFCFGSSSRILQGWGSGPCNRATWQPPVVVQDAAGAFQSPTRHLGIRTPPTLQLSCLSNT
jgi:hypothetical protein